MKISQINEKDIVQLAFKDDASGEYTISGVFAKNILNTLKKILKENEDNINVVYKRPPSFWDE